MTYKSHCGSYVFWNDEILIKFKTKNGKDAYLKKEVPFEDAPNYWEYVCEDGSWNVYYVKRGSNRRLAQATEVDSLQHQSWLEYLIKTSASMIAKR